MSAEHPETKEEYRAKYPNAESCPDCTGGEPQFYFRGGVCYLCICGCDWCEAGKPGPEREKL